MDTWCCQHVYAHWSLLAWCMAFAMLGVYLEHWVIFVHDHGYSCYGVKYSAVRVAFRTGHASVSRRYAFIYNICYAVNTVSLTDVTAWQGMLQGAKACQGKRLTDHRYVEQYAEDRATNRSAQLDCSTCPRSIICLSTCRINDTHVWLPAAVPSRFTV